VPLDLAIGGSEPHHRWATATATAQSNGDASAHQDDIIASERACEPGFLKLALGLLEVAVISVRSTCVMM
jgi:hypothetical protein